MKTWDEELERLHAAIDSLISEMLRRGLITPEEAEQVSRLRTDETTKEVTR